MSHSILRVARVKGSSNTKGIQRHNQRENENYNNKDINHEETYKNYDLINNKNIDYKQMIDEIIDANYAGKRAIRKDAIRHVDGLITSDNQFFDELGEAETNQFFRDSLDFLEQEYGEENILYATVHLDEKVPHMHFGFVPLTEDGRLSAKERIGNKKALTELQDRFNSYMNNRGYELERGISKEVTETEHRDMDRYKKDTQFHKQELQEVKSELQRVNKDFQSEIERMKSVSTFDYEDERKGLFSGREETGRKILSADEFERLQETISSAERIVEDYESIKNTDYYRENRQLRKDFDNQAEENYKLKNENDDLNEKLSLSQQFQDSTVALYHTARKHFPGFEKGFNQLKDKFLNDRKFERIGRFMEEVQDSVYKVDRQEERKREKRRTDDLEL